jgi:hypothetical protein
MDVSSLSAARVMYGPVRARQAEDTMTKRKPAKSPPKTPARLVKARIAEAAKRALAEAEGRRRNRPAVEKSPAERGGQAGPEPTRYGDWEKKGIISDF